MSYVSICWDRIPRGEKNKFQGRMCSADPRGSQEPRAPVLSKENWGNDADDVKQAAGSEIK